MRNRFAIRSAWVAYLVLTLDALILGSTGTVGKLALVEMPVMALIFWRWIAALLIFAPFALREFIARWPVIRRQWPIILALALLGDVQFNALWYIGLQTTSAINASLFSGVVPASVVLAAWIMTRETTTVRAVGGMVVAFVGLAWIVVQGDPTILANLELVVGDLVILLAVALWSVYTILLRRLPQELGLPAFMFFMYIVGVIVTAPFYAWEISQGATFTPSIEAAFLVLYLVVAVAMLHNVFWISGVTFLGGSKAGQFNYLVPVFGSGLAILFIGEDFHRYHLFGMILILIGVYLAVGSQRKKSTKSPTAA
jgi:drug/metabolite transporter (DMT)-like permease